MIGTAETEESALVCRVMSGDRAAFALIMRNNNQRLYRLAISVLGDASEAEDVLQESYVRAFLRLPQFAGRSSLGAWLAQIVRNEAIDRLRARRTRDNTFVLEADLLSDRTDGFLLEQQANDEGTPFDPENDMAREDMRSLLEEAIGALPVPFRTVFVLRAVEGLSIQETADFLGIPPATVKTRDHRARLLLRERLDARLDAAAKEAFAFLGAQCEAVVQRVLQRL